jgi:hypothetical protein
MSTEPRTETITCRCCPGYVTVDARSTVVAYMHCNDPAARAIRHALVSTSRR